MAIKFTMGRLCITQGAVQALFAARLHPNALLERHQSGDWGDLGDCDKAANESDLATGGRLLSCYVLTTGVKIYVITEYDRSYTTLMESSEY